MRGKLWHLLCSSRHAVCTENNVSIKDGTQLRGTSNGSAANAETSALSDVSGSGGDQLEGPPPATHDALHLKRRVGLFGGVALILGTMVGSGIFVSPSSLTTRTGSVGMSLVIWFLCGVLSLLGALAYAELGTMNASSGGEYVYFMDAFGPVPAFLFSWVSTWVLKPSQMAIICLSFAQYVVEAFVSDCEPPPVAIKLTAICVTMILAVINCYSVSLAMWFQNTLTGAKFLSIGVIVIGGVVSLCKGNTQHLENAFEGTTSSFNNLGAAFYTGLWAYDGWNNLNYATEEIENVTRILPLSIFIAIPMVTFFYVFINVAYLSVMSATEMSESGAVAVVFGKRMLGPFAFLMPLTVAVSTFGSANGTLFAAGRLCFAASREGHLFRILSYVHVRKLTPAPSIIFHSLIAVVMIAAGNIDSLIDFFSITAWCFYGMTMLALLYMRYTRPNAPRPYKVHIIIPIIVLIISVYLVIAPIVDNPRTEYIYAILFVILSVGFYLPFVTVRHWFARLDFITVFLQLLLEVAPTMSTYN